MFGFAKVINIKVVNSGSTPRSFLAFGYNITGLTLPGAVVNVTATPNSANFLNRESAQSPYVAKRMRVIINGGPDSQFNNSITITYARGSSVQQYNIEPADYQSPQNSVSNIIDIPLDNLVIDGTFSISGTIDGATTINMVIEYDNLFKKVSNLISNLGRNLAGYFVFASNRVYKP